MIKIRKGKSVDKIIANLNNGMYSFRLQRHFEHVYGIVSKSQLRKRIETADYCDKKGIAVDNIVINGPYGWETRKTIGVIPSILRRTG